jgi:hypothetical protein
MGITITIQYDNDNCKNSVAWTPDLRPLICLFVLSGRSWVPRPVLDAVRLSSERKVCPAAEVAAPPIGFDEWRSSVPLEYPYIFRRRSI